MYKKTIRGNNIYVETEDSELCVNLNKASAYRIRSNGERHAADIFYYFELLVEGTWIKIDSMHDFDRLKAENSSIMTIIEKAD